MGRRHMDLSFLMSLNAFTSPSSYADRASSFSGSEEEALGVVGLCAEEGGDGALLAAPPPSIADDAVFSLDAAGLSSGASAPAAPGGVIGRLSVDSLTPDICLPRLLCAASAEYPAPSF